MADHPGRLIQDDPRDRRIQACDHQGVLISTIAVGLSLAFVAGLVARRLGLPTVVGYLFAGVVIGPYTGGYSADVGIATELAEMGVILLMFGVGIHFSVRDLLAVRSVAVPGALAQILVVSALGTFVGLALGWPLSGAVILGITLSIASTVVLLRQLIELGELDSIQGRIAVGWLLVQDLVTVLILAVLPSIAPLVGGHATESSAPSVVADLGPLGELSWALLQIVVFGALMLVIGRRLVPPLLDLVARERSRELFILSVLALALGIAYGAAELLGVPLALGAFLAGAVVSESDTSHQAAADALPLRDAFAVLFFVSVGMLVDPAWIVANPLPVLAVTGVVVLGNATAAWSITTLMGYPSRVSLTLGAGLAQIGEFSFILMTLALLVGVVPPDAIQLVVAAALVSITLSPFLFRTVEPLARRADSVPFLLRLSRRSPADLAALDRTHPETRLRNHAIVCGHGRVGRLITSALDRRGFTYVVITTDRHDMARLRDQGTPVLYGDAADPALLTHAHLAEARVLIVAIANSHASRLIVDRAHELAPRVSVVVRTHSAGDLDAFQDMDGSVQPVMGEVEVAVQMTRYALTRFGVSMLEAEAVAQGLRGRGGRPRTPLRPTLGRGHDRAEPPA